MFPGSKLVLLLLNQVASTKPNDMQINYYYGIGEGQGRKKSQNHSKKSKVKFQELEKWKARVRDMIKICLGFR